MVRSRRWLTLVNEARTGAANMALDQALMARARRTGERVFRVYTWSQPTLSLGRHQQALGRIDPEALRTRGVGLVRRPTGGRALLHHREVTYSVTSPLGREESVRDWYESINAVLLAALRGLGVAAERATVTGRTPVPATASCFVRADEGEISFEGRKLVGSALLRQDDAILQHGSILLEDDQALLVGLLPPEEGRPAPAGTLSQALGVAPSVREVADALFSAVASTGAEVSALGPDPCLDTDAGEAERLYASDFWTFKA